MPTVLGNVNLFVRDVARAQQFYSEVLGQEVDDERSQPPSFALLRAGGCTLTLQDATTPGAALGASESVELGFAVDDVEVIRERMRAWGIDVGETQQMGWGGDFDARDEDGHRLTIYRMRS